MFKPLLLLAAAAGSIAPALAHAAMVHQLFRPGVTLFQTPYALDYDFVVAGAGGGDTYATPGGIVSVSNVGGGGALTSATIHFDAGVYLTFDVGVFGTTQAGVGGGGGGGSAVIQGFSPLMVAGGGGGAGNGSGDTGLDASTSSSGTTSGNGAPGSGAMGGGAGSSDCFLGYDCYGGGSGGAGVVGLGATNPDYGGGFGGAMVLAGGNHASSGGGGGGGGYSGGAGGDAYENFFNHYGHAGGGGGSFNNFAGSFLTTGANFGDGYVLLSYDAPPPPPPSPPPPSGVPEPSTWAIMLVGVGLMGGRLRRRAAGSDPKCLCRCVSSWAWIQPRPTCI